MEVFMPVLISVTATLDLIALGVGWIACFSSGWRFPKSHPGDFCVIA